MSRTQALELVLGAELLDAVTAERARWINCAVPAEELDAFVDRLAHDIAALPDGIIAAAKQALSPDDLRKGLLRVERRRERLVRGGFRRSRRRMRRARRCDLQSTGSA